MMLTLMVGWLVVSVLMAVLWSRMIRYGEATDSVHGDALPRSTEGNRLLLVPSPRRTQEGMAESSR